MRTFRTMGVIGGAAAVLLTAGVAFAQETPAAPAPVYPPPATSAMVPPPAALPPGSAPIVSVPQRPADALGKLTAPLAQKRPTTTARPAAIGAPGPMLATTTPSDRMQSMQERLQTARADAQERMTALRDKVQQRVAEIQDRVKQQMAAQLADRFDNLNATWTDHFAQLLDRYDAIAQKMQDRANIAASSGKDVIAVNSAIQAAKTAIEAARTAVAAQAAKTYTPDASTVGPAAASTTNPADQSQLMQGLRASFQTMQKSLFNDLFALRDGPMTSVRSALQSALQALGQVPGVDEAPTATTTPAANQ